MSEPSFNKIKGAEKFGHLSAKPNKRKKYLGPEADAYDRMKGKAVHIETNLPIPPGYEEGATIQGCLKWVDNFTIGIIVPPIGNYGEREVIVYKHCIATIQLTE